MPAHDFADHLAPGPTAEMARRRAPALRAGLAEQALHRSFVGTGVSRPASGSFLARATAGPCDLDGGSDE